MKKQYVDFDVIKDDYTICEVENGQILKIKQSLTDIVNITEENNKTKSGIGTTAVSKVLTPVEIDTSNLELAEPKQVTEKDQVKELNFKILKEPTNIYETKKSLILIITSIKKIFLTNKKDKENTPILRYSAVHQISVIDKLPPEVMKDARIE